MNSMFYPKLAASNLRKNAKTYYPYILSSICTIVTFYSMLSLSSNPGLGDLPGGMSVQILFRLGTIVIGIFAAALLFYTNSFLIKRRKKELGLYSILGMEKKHIAKILFFEVIFTAAISLLIGVLGGMLIEKLLFLALLAVLKIETPIVFTISPSVIVTTIVLFIIIFFLTLLCNLWQIKLANPITLLRGSEHGEREPKTKWILAILGFLALGAGYWIAVTVESPMDALALFFVAVLAVIIGTYCLFTAGSIAVLKLMKKNKSFYYRPNNFVSVSGMIYRMKQNAVGLANICILSTMVLVTISTTVCLYIGQDDMMRYMYPRDFEVRLSNMNIENGTIGKDEQRVELDEILKQAEAKYGVSLDDKMEYESLNLRMARKGNEFFAGDDKVLENTKYTELTLMTISEYNQLEGTSVALGTNDALIFKNSGYYGEDSLRIGSLELKIVQELDKLQFLEKTDYPFYDQYVLVVKDKTAFQDVLDALYGDPELVGLTDAASDYIGFNIKGDETAVSEASAELYKLVRQQLPYASCSSLENVKEDWYGTYGGFLFLGIFLGTLFMMAAILIIYYKQVSEGYDDHDRFEIMQKVGLSKKEVKKTIHKQVLMVFFLPLAVAIIHVAFAFNVIKRLLMIFGLTNLWLFAACTAATVLFFAMIYFIVYSLTAKSYYKIVEQK